MRAAIRKNISRRAVSRAASIPAPHGGWNTRDSVSDMPETDAIVLENWIPKADKVTLRSGYEEHVTGTGEVETLMTWDGPTSNKMFGCAGGNIYDVTSAGAVGAAVVTGLANNRFQHVNFSIASGDYLIAVNGADTVRAYNGTTWSEPAITGVTYLSQVNAHKKRLFFVEKDSLSFWYLGIEAIAGAATEFNLGSLCTMGGYLMAMATWSIDGGSGLDDMAVFITSQGETIIYQGDNPGDVNAWSLVGVFRLGRPIGRRCFVKLGSDLIVLTEDGFVPLSASLISDRSKPIAISDKISPTVNSAFQNYGTLFGWQAVHFPKQGLLLFNIPSTGASVQYVMNIVNGSWCKFTGMDAHCWAVLGGELYFGGDTAVYAALTGTSDNGANIPAFIKPAFSYFRSRGRLKAFLMVRPVIEVTGTLTATLEVNVDYEDRLPTDTPTFSDTGVAPWNTSPWNTTPWSRGAQIKKDWQSVNGVGYCATCNMKTLASPELLAIHSFDYIFEDGEYV